MRYAVPQAVQAVPSSIHPLPKGTPGTVQKKEIEIASHLGEAKIAG